MLAKHLVASAAQTWKGHKTQVRLSLRLSGVPENLNLNLNGLDLGSTRNPGPTSDSCRQSNLSLSSVNWESTHTVSGGKPSAARTL